MFIAYAWRLVVRQFPVILVLALAGLVVAFGYSAHTKTYSTTTYLTVLPTKDQAGLRAVDPLRFFQTQTQAILGDPLLADAASRLGDGTTVEDLRLSVSVSDGSTADVVGVTVSGPTSAGATARQRAVLAAIDSYTFPAVTMTKLWVAPLVSPSDTKALLAGLVGGAAAGVLLVLLWGAIRRPVHHPRYLQLDDDVRTYPLVLDVHRPDQVQQFQHWLGRPAGRVVGAGRSDAQASRLSAHIGVDEAAGGPTLLVAAAGRATENNVEEQVSLNSQGEAPVLVVVSANRRKRAQR
ncbi:YveK family protein [Phycicoccus sp. Root563]|uniref:hypothetical protein n=1 Tax=Phycicoccus sp. Root563 TaxID=1736562 RepID=UPI000702F684|nr:hypothetical protein [Phycicoccus sp. Root563]KQZ90573.1 hypothetical protein ASD62_16065 [Phycicoccus sp. Root563]